jgi:hypothetical protein
MSVGDALGRGTALVLLATSAACSAPAGDAAAAGRGIDGGTRDSMIEAAPGADAGTSVDAPLAAPFDAAALTSAPAGPFLVSATTAGPGDSHTSPAIVAGSAGLVAAFDDTDEDVTTHAVGWARSTDDGASFTDEGHFPDPTAGGVEDNYGYPCIARDRVNGNVYVAALGSTPQSSNAIAFFASHDDGVLFDPATNAADPNLAASDYIDFPAIAVDNGGGSAEGTVYVAYADFVEEGTSAVKLRLSTYTQGAFAVTEVVSPALGSGDEASLPSVAVAPDHQVFIAYYSQTAGSPALAVVGSPDQGNHFGAPVQVTALHTPIAQGSFDGDLGLLGDTADGGVAPLIAYASPVLQANPVSGNLYLVYVDASGNDKANIYFTESTDSARTWSSPVRVNDDQTTNDQFLPAMAVSLDGTHLAVDFYDRRSDGANLLASRYGATAVVSGAAVTFGANFPLSPAPFPVLVDADPLLAPGYFAVHTSMTADAAYFYDAYTDGADGHLDVRLFRYGVLY